MCSVNQTEENWEMMTITINFTLERPFLRIISVLNFKEIGFYCKDETHHNTYSYIVGFVLRSTKRKKFHLLMMGNYANTVREREGG